VVADEEVLSAAVEMAQVLAKGPTRAFGETKRLLLTGMTASLESQLEQEALAITALAASADGREGMAAFIGKRPPGFMGQ
jgi:2-(1,2-epoxy-1,2-dihydrophenyl)acetyl-CoA isomerase